jgi:hypothetical protein
MVPCLRLRLKHPDKAHLVADSITEITEDSILAGGNRFNIDVVIYATGFDTAKSVCGFRTEGNGGKVLSDQVSWFSETVFLFTSLRTSHKKLKKARPFRS